MLKLMKYEFRKLRTTLMIMGLALLALEAAFVIGDRMENYELVGISLGVMTMLAFAVYLYILVAGIVSYSRELNDKTGYMTFMVPVSPAGVVASKLIFTILAALAATAVFGAAAFFDFRALFSRAQIDANMYRQVEGMLRIYSGMNLTSILLRIGVVAGTVVIEILAVMCAAYLAITLSATLLQNRKGFLRGLVSFAIFAALQFITSRVGGMAAGYTDVETFEAAMGHLGWQVAVDGAFCVLFASASAVLLDRRVSL